MKAFWQGFFSIFDFSSFDLMPRSGRRTRNIVRQSLERSKEAQQWYHPGEWYDHPMYGKNKHEKR